MRILCLLRRRLKNASTFSNSSLKANPNFPSEEERKAFAKQKSNPLASAINDGTEKDSKESFYVFKLKK
ncbi:MAG: hypothetical protein HXL12_02640 [Candidatus Nanosynbacter sp.]|nr:hypothetical protein [Candidatus Nanosynbacter sp.]